MSYKNNTEFDTYFGGTSQSADFVSGLASLLIAQTPTITHKEVKELIEKTANDRVGDQNEDLVGRDNYYGNGRINAYEALLVNAPIPFELKEEDVNVYPNPSNGVFSMNYPEEVETVTICNAMGVKINEFAAKSLNGTQITTDVNGYVLLIFKYQEQVVTKKVVLIN